MTPHVLVVDDDPDVREVVAFQVRLLGHEVTLASTLEAALTVLESAGAIDIVVTDVDLGGGDDGRHLVEACRGRGLAAVVMSGDELAPVGVPSLRKPVDLADLSAALRAAVG